MKLKLRKICNVKFHSSTMCRVILSRISVTGEEVLFQYSFPLQEVFIRMDIVTISAYGRIWKRMIV